jgi:sugar-specific transcriptional regulator TrmB
MLMILVKISLSLFLLSLIVLIFFICRFLIEKRNQVIDETNKVVINKLPISDTIKNTNDLLSLISDRIDDAINEVFQEYLILNKKYNFVKLDEDIKKIAESVFNGLNKDMIILSTSELMITDEYIFTYIVMTTKLRVLNYTKNWNDFYYTTDMDVQK